MRYKSPLRRLRSPATRKPRPMFGKILNLLRWTRRLLKKPPEPKRYHSVCHLDKFMNFVELRYPDSFLVIVDTFAEQEMVAAHLRTRYRGEAIGILRASLTSAQRRSQWSEFQSGEMRFLVSTPGMALIGMRLPDGERAHVVSLHRVRNQP